MKTITTHDNRVQSQKILRTDIVLLLLLSGVTTMIATNGRWVALLDDGGAGSCESCSLVSILCLCIVLMLVVSCNPKK